MKKFLPLLVALLLLPAALVGCADKLPQSTPDTETTYLQRIAELEAALAQEKEARYISDAAHAATIKELQSKLDALTATDPNAPSAPNEDDLVFHYKLQDGKAVITGFSGASTLVSIPATLDGHPVTAIGERAFFRCKSLTAVYYTGSREAFKSVKAQKENDCFKRATIYYYTEEKPARKGNNWHYVDGVPTVWGNEHPSPRTED